MFVQNQSQAQPQSSIGKSYVQTTTGTVHVITIIFGMIAVGLAYTEMFLLEERKPSPFDYDYHRPDYNNNNRPDRPRPRPRPIKTRCGPPVEIERTFLSVTSIALILSVASLYINSLEYVKSSCPDATFHKVAGPIVTIVGFMYFVVGTFYIILSKPSCSCINVFSQCKYTYQLFAGLVTFFNGMLYYGMCCCCNNSKPAAQVPMMVGQNYPRPNPTPSQVQNMPMQNNMPNYQGATPSRQNVPGAIPLQQKQQPIQNAQQFRPPPAAPVQQKVGVAQPPPPPNPPQVQTV